MWQPALAPGAWQRAMPSSKGARQGGGRGRRALAQPTPLPESWPARVLGVTALCRLTNFRHLGLFPRAAAALAMDARASWRRSRRSRRACSTFLLIRALPRCWPPRPGPRSPTLMPQARRRLGQRQPAAVGPRGRRRSAGSSRTPASSWRASCGAAKPTMPFLVDPPKFGRGPAGEVWDVFQHLPALLRDCAAPARHPGGLAWCSPPMPSAPRRWPATAWCASACVARRRHRQRRAGRHRGQAAGGCCRPHFSAAGAVMHDRAPSRVQARAPSPACKTSA